MGSDDENVQFVIIGAAAESRPAYMSMSRERYNRIMQPTLGDAEEVDPRAPLDERCYPHGHTWWVVDVIDGDACNGYEAICLVCGTAGVRKWTTKILAHLQN